MNWKRFFLVCLVLTAGLGLTFQSLDAKSRHSSSGYKNFGASTILKKTSWGVEFQPNIEEIVKSMKTKKHKLYHELNINFGNQKKIISFVINRKDICFNPKNNSKLLALY